MRRVADGGSGLSCEYISRSREIAGCSVKDKGIRHKAIPSESSESLGVCGLRSQRYVFAVTRLLLWTCHVNIKKIQLQYFYRTPSIQERDTTNSLFTFCTSPTLCNGIIMNNTLITYPTLLSYFCCTKYSVNVGHFKFFRLIFHRITPGASDCFIINFFLECGSFCIPASVLFRIMNSWNEFFAF